MNYCDQDHSWNAFIYFTDQLFVGWKVHLTVLWAQNHHTNATYLFGRPILNSILICIWVLTSIWENHTFEQDSGNKMQIRSDFHVANDSENTDKFSGVKRTDNKWTLVYQLTYEQLIFIWMLTVPCNSVNDTTLTYIFPAEGSFATAALNVRHHMDAC